MSELVSHSHPRIALIGECMIELQQHANGSLQQSFGGDTLNTAVYIARLLGRTAQVDYVTALGDDSFSDAMCRVWEQEGIGLSKVQRLPGRLPGLYCIQTDANGERRFLYWRNEAAVRDCFNTPESDAILNELQNYDVVYLSGITLAVLGEHGRERLLSRLAQVRARGVRVVFDNNYRPRLWENVDQAREAYRACMACVDLALLTEDDEQALYGYADSEALLTAYRELGISEVVVKRGARSCLVESGGERFEVAAHPVSRVVDTTAAGDSFSAGYLVMRLRGASPVEAANAGHHLASLVIQHPGALVPASVMPSL
ncbi:ketodeoxygluconokinase [Pseudomonas syringae]|uniref:2-dehydro-3-deoxygluconokinase n=1 Tax=Pseudomonas syringae TaxID=317 RepID=A0A1C7YV39_PSESX|nr:sugar kinase [Pseudomonas syringae]OCR21604.1 ketodeoxygluconokinase [Pseudomonas syringae]